MIELLYLLVSCILFVGLLWGMSNFIDALRYRKAQIEIAQSDDWERKMQEVKHDF